MGFFSSIKNFLTGGGVEMDLQIRGECHLRKPFMVDLLIKVDKEDIEADMIYVHIKYIESVQASGHARNSKGHSVSETFYEDTVLYEDKIVVDDNKLLSAETDYEYEVEIELPLEVHPSFQGVNAKLGWSIQAFIDKPGNDPNSKLLIFEPLYEII